MNAHPSLKDRTLSALGLHRTDLRAWAMYDWGISAYETTIVTAVFPIYFMSVAASGLEESTASAYMAWANSATILLVAVVSPFLGAMADYAAIRKKLLAGFLAGGLLAGRRRGSLQRPRFPVVGFRQVHLPAAHRAECEPGALPVAGGDVADPVGPSQRDRLLARTASAPGAVGGHGGSSRRAG